MAAVESWEALCHRLHASLAIANVPPENAKSRDPILYGHSQPGWLTLFVFVASGLLLVSVRWGFGGAVGGGSGDFVLMAVSALLIVCMMMFSSLTIRLTSEELLWYFGPGWPRWRVPVSAIVSCDTVRPPWWWGWGIRLTPRGWMYNVSGRQGVLVRRRDGSSFILGTDEPERLGAAIRSAVNAGR